MNRVQPDTTLPKTPEIINYTGLLSQYGSNDPTILILENKLNLTIIWNRNGGGNYTGYIEEYGEYPSFDLTQCATVQITSTTPTTITAVSCYLAEIQITTNVIGTGYDDNQLVNTPIEIKIFKEKAKFY